MVTVSVVPAGPVISTGSKTGSDCLAKTDGDPITLATIKASIVRSTLMQKHSWWKGGGHRQVMVVMWGTCSAWFVTPGVSACKIIC